MKKYKKTIVEAKEFEDLKIWTQRFPSLKILQDGYRHVVHSLAPHGPTSSHDRPGPLKQRPPDRTRLSWYDMTCGLCKVSCGHKISQGILHVMLIIIRSNHPAQKREKRSLCQQSRQQSGHRLIEDGHVIEDAANRFISAKVSAHGFHGLHKSCPESGQHSASDVFYNEEGHGTFCGWESEKCPKQGNLAEFRTSSFSKGLTRSSKPSNSWQICNVNISKNHKWSAQGGRKPNCNNLYVALCCTATIKSVG